MSNTNNHTDIAPILITVYNRYEHFKQCIESLQKNDLSIQSDLFIAIDYPSIQSDIAVHKKIISYCKTIIGFKAVNLIIRNKNIGSVKNVFLAMDEVFSKYDRLIYSEDDNVFSPYFLQFINDGLTLYKESTKVFSICGYRHLFDAPSDYNYETFFAKNISAWGIGLWRDKFKQVDLNAKKFDKIFTNPLTLIDFIKNIGCNTFSVLLDAKNKKTIYGDASMEFHAYLNNLLTLFPSDSLVRNQGNDGSGEHCGVDDRFIKQKLLMQPINKFIADDYVFESIQHRQAINIFFLRSKKQLIKTYIKYIFFCLKYS